jgi:high-affinity Fe2+/Pb2+ permease
MTVDVFSVPVFLVVFREALETVIIVSVLLAFLKQTLGGPEADVTVYKRLVRQVSSTASRPFGSHASDTSRRCGWALG